MSTFYTVKFVNQPLPNQMGEVSLIEQTIKAAGMWLSSYIKGSGTINLNVNFDPTIPTMSGASLANQFVSNVKAANGNTYRLLQDSVPTEIQTGIDINGTSADGIINIGTTNLDHYYWFDETLSSADDIPQNKTDGFRVILHELLHTMGFNGWVSTAATGTASTVCSPYDQFFQVINGRSYFTGANAERAFGGPVPITGSHLGDSLSFSQGVLKGDSTLMSYDSVPNGSRISLDPVVIGVLRDMGYTVRDTQASFTGQNGKLNTAMINSASTGYELVYTLDLTWLTFADKSDYSYLLQNEQRLQFTDVNVALDIAAGEVAGQAFRLYQAAFDRKPDLTGLGYWIKDMDNGSSLTTVAAGFFQSPEFQKLYGSNPSTMTLITNFYNNVLHRAPDQAGFDYWAAEFNTGKITPAGALASFCESTENQALVIGSIQNGIEYTPWLG